MSQEKMMQLIKGGDSHMFSASDDSAVMKQILSTHLPDGRQVNVRPLLHLVEGIFQRAHPSLLVIPQEQTVDLEENINQDGVIGQLEAFAYTIHRVSCELSCKCAGGGDAHSTTVAIFNILANYSWDAKVVFALGAFAVNYGEFLLMTQMHTIDPLAKSLALLKQFPNLLEHNDILKPRFDALNNLSNIVLNVAKCIIELKELPTEYFSPESHAMSTATAYIPNAVYWSIRSIVACASQIISLIGLGHEHIASTTEIWELSSLAHKLSNIHGYLTKQLALCNQEINEKKEIEAYQALVRLFETVHIDNMKIIKALIRSKDDLPLYDGTTRGRVGVDVLKKKIVILFISDIEISGDEVLFLAQIYDTHQRKMDRNYEVVWLPLVERNGIWTEEKLAVFNRLASFMPWYSLHHPSVLQPAVIKYIRQAWHFEKKPLLVVLDPVGKVVNPNALHMILIWGTLAYPFSTTREEALWKGETWTLEFLVDDIDPIISKTWIREGRFICLYGGEDVAWIRKFTSAMKKVAVEAGIPLDMIYVGKSNHPIERTKRIISVIADNKLSNYWDPAMIWVFWIRLESMWHSKRIQKQSIENDIIMQEVMTMLTYDGSDEGWALVSRGSTNTVKSQGKKIVECLLDFQTWKDNVKDEGFISALANALQPYHTIEHCTRLILPGDTGKIKESVICAECKRPMEKYILYRCCND